ncbi:hypothetical protein IE077_004036 [Cardiosporidium cionae]|uniref:C-CAP/cofactor C-like domain-containing protein n=1 Tax=Cardiosporidium cionae TaxID=476202 RepID=A0ABQ7JEB8_9APIC|nr:hypothetical protein IE077_004036 [Cardiosporidium cionae]|eukprot:KAF8822303.1 hypothetical protein IE077_004036 [Cardiosporidium cionae]
MSKLSTLISKTDALEVSNFKKNHFSFQRGKALPKKIEEPVKCTTDLTKELEESNVAYPDVDGEKQLHIKHVKNQRLLYGPEDIKGKKCMLTNLENCEIYLLDDAVAAVLRNVKFASVSSSIMVYDCKESILLANAKQIRIHDSCDLSMYLKTNSSPIIERCQGIMVAPYLFQFEGEQCDVLTFPKNFNVENEKNNAWSHILDFNWHKKTASPNWSILQDKKRITPSTLKLKKLALESSTVLEHSVENRDEYQHWSLENVPGELLRDCI